MALRVRRPQRSPLPVATPFRLDCGIGGNDRCMLDPFFSAENAALLVMAALIGVPVSVVAFGFLALVGELRPLLYTDLPEAIGWDKTPLRWPLPLLAVGGGCSRD